MLFLSLENPMHMVKSFVNTCWEIIDLVNIVGIYTIDVSMMSAESKENSNSWMWYALIIKFVL